MNNLKIGTRLSILIAALTSLLFVVGALGLWGTVKANESARLIYEESLVSTGQIAEIQKRLLANRLAIAVALVTPTAEVIASSAKTVESNIAEITNIWTNYSASPKEAIEKQLADKFASDRKAFVQDGLLKTLVALRANDIKEANRLVVENIRPLYQPVGIGIDALFKHQVDAAKRNYEESLASYTSSRNLSVASILGGTLFALFFGIYLVRGITRPLSQAVESANAIAAGKLDGVIDSTNKDETGLLLHAMSQMQIVLSRFQAAQTRMAEQHEAGNMNYVMPVADLPGDYGVLASNVNMLVQSGVALTMKTVDVVAGYSEGQLDVAMDRLPGQKARISEAMDKVQRSLKDAAEASVFNLRIRTSLDSLPVCVTVSNDQALMVHATPPARELLKLLGGPQFEIDALYGKKLSSLFASTDDARRFDKAVHSGDAVDLELGGRKLRLLARPVLNPSGQTIGRATHWIDRTDEIASEMQLDAMVAAASRGDFSGRLSLQGKTGFFASVSSGMNQLMQTSEQGLTDVADLLAAFAEGDLTKRIERDYEGLFGAVKASANTTADNLSRILSEVRDAADALTGAANQVSATAQSLSQAASEQAASVEETTSQIAVMSASISQNSDNAKITDNMATKTSTEAQEGGLVVGQTVSAMKQIAAKIGIVDDIAYQIQAPKAPASPWFTMVATKMPRTIGTGFLKRAASMNARSCVLSPISARATTPVETNRDSMKVSRPDTND